MSKAKKCMLKGLHIAKIFFYRFGILTIAVPALTWYLQYRYFENDADKTWKFLDEHALVFWYTALLVGTILLLCYGIVRGPFKSIAMLFTIITIIGYINITKYNFRGTPVLPEDFQLADQTGALTKFIDIGVLIRTIIACILSVFLGILLDKITKQKLNYDILDCIIGKKGKKGKKDKKSSILVKRALLFITPRVIIITTAVALFFSFGGYVLNHDGKKEEYIPEIGAHFIGWSQVENYDENGFLVGFLYNMRKQSMQEPENYGESAVSSLKEKYTNNTSNSSKKLNDADYNIIIILDESFYDPSIISDYYEIEGPDVTPNLHRIQKKYPSGYMYSTDYGGGTANVEFEVLTGLSNYWANTVPYTDILTKIKGVTSIAHDAKKAGYKTSAFHSFTGEMYKREVVLEKEGFERFVTEEQMSNTEKEGDGDYIKDSELYKEILQSLKGDNDKQLIFAITMQNHAPYAYGKYPHESYDFWIPRLAENFDNHAEILSYLQTLHYSDEYLGEFIDELGKLEEKTVVLFFGDHAPGIISDVHDNDEKAVSDLSHLTPYFIWTNFDSDKTNEKEAESDSKKETTNDEKTEIDDSKKETKELSKNAKDFLSKFNVPEVFKETTAEKISLPTTTPNCLVNTLYNYLKLDKTAQQNLLDQVCTKTPILAPSYLMDNAPENEKAFKEYELLNYDILSGQQYWLK